MYQLKLLGTPRNVRLQFDYREIIIDYLAVYYDKVCVNGRGIQEYIIKADKI